MNFVEKESIMGLFFALASVIGGMLGLIDERNERNIGNKKGRKNCNQIDKEGKSPTDQLYDFFKDAPLF